MNSYYLKNTTFTNNLKTKLLREKERKGEREREEERTPFHEFIPG